LNRLKIAVLRNREDGSFRVRCQTPLAWLQKEGAIEIVPPLRAWEADVVLLHAQWQRGADAVVRSLRRHGIRVVTDVDENIFAAPPFHPLAAVYADAEFQVRARHIIGAVDAVLAATAHLAETLKPLNSKVAVTPNGIELSAWPNVTHAQDRVRVIGFAGLASHQDDLEMLRPALNKLSGTFAKEKIRFVCLGCRPPWLSETLPGAEILEAYSAKAYSLYLNGMNLDIALAPLAISEYNLSRSALKFWEYSAAGAVTIASNVGPFTTAIQNERTGLLVDSDPESWVRAISGLIRNHELRRRIRESARLSLATNDVSRTAPALLAALEATQPDTGRVLFALPRTQMQVCPDVDIVIPIYNSPELSRQSIEAALPELDASHRLILVDDASPDPAISQMLAAYRGRPWVTIHRNVKNEGFVGACNLVALELARPEADVILMNADTRPMPGFVARLAASAGSNPAIGTVTAVSNQGWIASVPDFADAKELAAIENPLMISPTACGFLLYVKREVIRKYGLFDTAFAPGYCEEVDFSLRISPEYLSVIDTGCWTWHANSASFGDTKFKLSADHNALIDQRYPQFRFELAAFNASRPLLSYRAKMLRATRDARPRVLHVLHSHGSVHGTGKHVQDLGSALSDRFLSLAAAANEAQNPAQEQLELYCGEVQVGTWPYAQPGWPQTAGDIPVNSQAWEKLLNEVKPNLIHFHHPKNHALNLLTQLVTSQIPVIVSLHDYYMVCPDFSLQACPGVLSCDTCYPKRFNGPAQYQHLRRALLYTSLKQAAAVIAPSHTAASLIRQVYTDLNIQVVPHGIRPIPRLTRRAGSKIRFGMLGNVNAVKGIDLMLKVWPLVAENGAAELHLYGAGDPAYIRGLVSYGMHCHGAYCETDLPRILSEIDIGVLPSQAPETFSYTLSEFFAGGIPVVGSDFGALSERIENGVNGFKIVKDDVRSWAAVLNRLTDDAALRERITKGVRPPGSIEEMAAQYAELYTRVLGGANRSTPGSLSSLAQVLANEARPLADSVARPSGS